MAFLLRFVVNVVKAQVADDHTHWNGLKGQSYVNKLNPDSVEGFIRYNKIVSLFFYSHTCPHCIKFMPEIAKAAQNLDNQNINVKMGAVDVVHHPQLQKKFSLNGVPTVQFYMDGTFAVEYKASRNADDIVQFARDLALGQKSGL